MSNDGFIVLVMIICVAVICAVLSGVLVNDAWQTECVEKGFAEWAVASNGRATWKWKELR